MASGDLLLDDAGNRILDDSGNEQVSDGAGDDCCCGGGSCACASSTPCPNCPASTTPNGFTLSLSGVTVSTACQSCVAADPTFGTQIPSPGTINGTFSLPQQSACLWGATGAAFSILNYATDCTTFFGPTGFSYYYGLTRINATQFELIVSFESSGVDSGRPVVLFHGIATVASCCNSFAMTNDTVLGCNTMADGSQRVGLATGGTATISPC